MDREGGYVDHPDDSGGPTRYGITQETARSFGYKGPMSEFPRAEAEKIYEARYWHSLKLDLIEPISADIAEELADTGINMGTHRAATFLQRSLNVLNAQERYYPDIEVDGWVGRMTVGALKELLRRRQVNGELVMLRMLNSLQGASYVRLAERREKDESFVFGWFLHRVA
jgi:lysozyme family protein